MLQNRPIQGARNPIKFYVQAAEKKLPVRFPRPMTKNCERIFTFLKDPFASKGPEVYQITETLIALGSGMLLGRGLGSGYAKFGFVPTPYTDSIFALLGEELGLAGTCLVLGLFLCLAYRGFRIASRATDSFGQVLATGLTFWIIFQALVNIAVVTATAPYTGVPLPFISYGGTSLATLYIGVGILMSVHRHRKLIQT